MIEILNQRKNIEEIKGMKILRDVKYCETEGYDGNIVDLHMDVYRTDRYDESIKPPVILIHGGGFSYGDKDTPLQIKTYAIHVFTNLPFPSFFPITALPF